MITEHFVNCRGLVAEQFGRLTVTLVEVQPVAIEFYNNIRNLNSSKIFA